MLTWPSCPGNNDDTASCHLYMFTTYKRCRCVALQSASTSLNDPLMSTVEVHPWQSEVTHHGHWTDVESVRQQWHIGAGGQLDSELQRNGMWDWGGELASATAVVKPSTAYAPSVDRYQVNIDSSISIS